MKRLTLILFGFLNVLLVRAEETPPPVGCPTISVTGQAVSCYAGSNGAATVSVVAGSGSGNYTYTWSTGASSTSISGLTAGTYTVNVKDNVSGCTAFGAYVVNQPSPIVTSETHVDVNCRNMNTGSIDLTVSGGVAPYAYDWNYNGPGYGDPQDLVGRPAGTYTVTVRDANMCTSPRTVIITQPAEVLSRSATSIPVQCNGGNTGSIDLTVWGGTFPYSYSWSNGASSQDISNLNSGNYNCNITDFKGCLTNISVFISQPSPVTGTLTPTNVLCNGGNTGSVLANISGGVAPYDYSWENATTLYSTNTFNLTGIPAGNYQLTVTDNRGCISNYATVVTQPSKLMLSSTKVNVTCNGYSNGSINLTPSGGTSPYSYAWVNQNNTSFGTAQDLNLIPAGTYTVVVTDANNCTETTTVTITEPLLPLTATHTSVNVNCFGNMTGSIDVTPTGGTNPLSYSWTNSASTQDVVSLGAGTYGYTITDANACVFSSSVIITQPAAPLSTTFTTVDVNCYGESNGSIDLSPAGGTSPYAYSWVNSTYQMSLVTQDIVNLPADTYSYVITDNKGCTIAGNVTITQPTLLTSTISGVNILCKGGNNGSVDLTVSGGVVPYTYSWNTAAGTEDLANLVAGPYSVLVTDDHGCTITNQITLTEPNYALSYDSIIKHVKCNNGDDGMISITVAGGTSPYFYDWSNGGTFPTASDLTAGTYSFIVTDNNGCELLDTLVVNEPAPLAMNEVITPVTCYGGKDGIIDVNPTGGTQPYNYTWYNSMYSLSAQTQDLNGYESDTFQLELIDSNNCFYEMFWFIPQPSELAATFSSDNVNCAGGTDGSILVDVTGGNGGYTYNWSSGQTSEDIINVPIGVYDFMVTDSKGCQDSLSVEIFEPLPVSAWFEITPVLCKDQYDGVIITHAGGGTGNYTYSWSNGATVSNIDGLPTDFYTINIEDVIGCTFDTTVFVSKINEFCLFPVNTISPNGDNYNDTWIIDNMEVYPDAEVQMYNKWGNMVWNHKGVYEPWDGRIGGQIAPTEVYYYIIYLNNADGDKINGSLTIIK